MVANVGIVEILNDTQTGTGAGFDLHYKNDRDNVTVQVCLIGGAATGTVTIDGRMSDAHGWVTLQTHNAGSEAYTLQKVAQIRADCTVLNATSVVVTVLV